MLDARNFYCLLRITYDRPSRVTVTITFTIAPHVSRVTRHASLQNFCHDLLAQLRVRNQFQGHGLQRIATQFNEVTRGEIKARRGHAHVVQELDALRTSKTTLEATLRQMEAEKSTSSGGPEFFKLQHKVSDLQDKLISSCQYQAQAAELQLKMHKTEQLLESANQQTRTIADQHQRERTQLENTTAQLVATEQANAAANAQLVVAKERERELEERGREMQMELLQARAEKAEALCRMEKELAQLKATAAAETRARAVASMGGVSAGE